MKRKNLFLSLALILPILVFLFLKFFGKNKFEIPIFHQTKIESVADCDLKYQLPYTVADSILTSLHCDGKRATLILFKPLDGENDLRFKEEIEQSKLQIVSIDDSLSVDFKKGLSCVFLLPVKENAILVDEQRRIRGYYHMDSREEMDRLLVELKILFNEY